MPTVGGIPCGIVGSASPLRERPTDRAHVRPHTTLKALTPRGLVIRSRERVRIGRMQRGSVKSESEILDILIDLPTELIHDLVRVKVGHSIGRPTADVSKPDDTTVSHPGRPIIVNLSEASEVVSHCL